MRGMGKAVTPRLGDADHPHDPAHVVPCAFCRTGLRVHHEMRDHRRCHLYPALRCRVSRRWLEPVREAARAAIAEHGVPGAVAVV